MDTLLSCSDSLRLVLDHRARWVSLVNARSSLVHSSDQQCHSVWSGHWLLLGRRIAFSEVESEVGDSLSEGFDGNRLEISVSMVESFDSTVLNQGSGISDDSTGGAANMRIDLEDLLN